MGSIKIDKVRLKECIIKTCKELENDKKTLNLTHITEYFENVFVYKIIKKYNTKTKNKNKNKTLQWEVRYPNSKQHADIAFTDGDNMIEPIEVKIFTIENRQAKLKEGIKDRINKDVKKIEKSKLSGYFLSIIRLKYTDATKEKLMGNLSICYSEEAVEIVDTGIDQLYCMLYRVESE